MDRPVNQVIAHDSSFVEYYFDIRVDDEIPSSAICECTTKLKSQGIYVDSQYDCPEVPFEATTKSPYDVVQEIDLAICDDDDPSSPPKMTVVETPGGRVPALGIKKKD
jgi:hypothetical protein